MKNDSNMESNKPKREGFFALTNRLNRIKKDQDEDPRLSDEDKKSLEGKDYVAMILSSFLTLFLPAILVLGIISVGAMALFGVFS